MSDYSIFLYMAALPLGMLALIAIAGRLFRRRVESSMELSAAAANEQTAPDIASAIPELQLIRVDASEVTPEIEATRGASEASEARLDVSMAFIAASIAYTAVSSGAIVAGMVSLHHYREDVPVAVAYMLQWVPLVIVLWVLELSWKVRLLALASYLGVGLVLAICDASWSRAFNLLWALSQFTVLIPLAAVFPLLIRRLRPWLLALVAILLFLVMGASVTMIAKINIDIATAKLWTAILGVIYTVSAIILVRWLLQRERWAVTAAPLAALTIAGVVFLVLHRPAVGMTLLGLPGNVIQVLLVWAIFKGFVTLQEKQLLPAQVLHSHLCWGALTLYLVAAISWGGTLYGHLWWGPWAIAAAYGLYLLVLHAWLHRLWRSRAAQQGKRLLLLRVFGKADERERLLDWIDNSWRFIGRVDLIAGTDLAERTLGARMLEAFLLRRSDQMFLRTPDDVSLRLANLHSQLEGDTRYPVNSVYCYASAWREAVQRLAPDSDAVLMDLRGFSATNQGCIFELTWIVQWLSLRKIVLLTDTSTDCVTLEQTVRHAWSKLPANSPSAGEPDAKLTIAEADGRSAEAGVFTLLLNAAAFPRSI